MSPTLFTSEQTYYTQHKWTKLSRFNVRSLYIYNYVPYMSETEQSLLQKHKAVSPLT